MQHLKHLSKDKKLKPLVTAYQDLEMRPPTKKIYLQLINAIISQQLSTKVAAIIQDRFRNLFANKSPKPEQILALPFDDLKAIGLSNSKTQYIHNVCQFFIERKLTDQQIMRLDNEEIIELLVQIKGIGRWTVEMILMFGMGREDLFPADDLGIQKAMCRIYGIDNTNKKIMIKQMNEIADYWSPYRTYASLYLWKSLDVK